MSKPQTGQEKMMLLLKKVGPSVLAKTWDWYLEAPRVDADGNPKYTGILFYAEGIDGSVIELQVGELANYQESLEIVGNKLLCMEEMGVCTSIEGRKPLSTPPFWGGAAHLNNGFRAGITGGTELQDHLLLLGSARIVEQVSLEDYGAWTNWIHSGVKESAQQFGLRDGGYHNMKSFIEGQFHEASALLDLSQQAA